MVNAKRLEHGIKIPTSFGLSQEIVDLLEIRSKKARMSKSAYLESILRELLFDAGSIKENPEQTSSSSIDVLLEEYIKSKGGLSKSPRWYFFNQFYQLIKSSPKSSSSEIPNDSASLENSSAIS